MCASDEWCVPQSSFIYFNTFQEANSINKSLSALGDVISALSADLPHVPYRNSKLTQVVESKLTKFASWNCLCFFIFLFVFWNCKMNKNVWTTCRFLSGDAGLFGRKCKNPDDRQHLPFRIKSRWNSHIAHVRNPDKKKTKLLFHLLWGKTLVNDIWSCLNSQLCNKSESYNQQCSEKCRKQRNCSTKRGMHHFDIFQALQGLWSASKWFHWLFRLFLSFVDRWLWS